MLHGVERILKRLGDVLLDIFRTRTRIHGYDHESVGVDIGIKVDRKLGE